MSQETIHLIIRDAETKQQKIITVSTSTTIEEIIKETYPERKYDLVHQNIILERKRTVSDYKLSDYTILYISQPKNVDLLSQLINLSEISEGDEFILPFLNDIIQNQSHLFTDSNRNMNVNISISTGRNNAPRRIIQLQRRPSNRQNNNSTTSDTNTNNNNLNNNQSFNIQMRQGMPQRIVINRSGNLNNSNNRNTMDNNNNNNSPQSLLNNLVNSLTGNLSSSFDETINISNNSNQMNQSQQNNQMN